MLHKELNEFDVAYEESLLNFIWNTLIFGEKYIYMLDVIKIGSCCYGVY